LGQVRVQLRMVWQRYRLIELSSAALRSAFFSSRESAIHRYDCRRMAGPRYSSEFHQYDGQAVEQHAQRMHSYSPSSFLRSALLCRYSLPCGRRMISEQAPRGRLQRGNSLRRGRASRAADTA